MNGTDLGGEGNVVVVSGDQKGRTVFKVGGSGR